MGDDRQRSGHTGAVRRTGSRWRTLAVVLVAGAACSWPASPAGATPATTRQDIGSQQELEQLLGMPTELASSPGTVAHGAVISTASNLEFDLGVVRDGNDLDDELAAVTAELSGEGWELDDPKSVPGTYELQGWRGDAESIEATVETQPDGSVAVLYRQERAGEVAEAAAPGQLLADVEQLRVHDSLTLSRVGLSVTAAPLRFTDVFGSGSTASGLPQDLDIGTDLSIEFETTVDNLPAVSEAVVGLCARSDFQCPDRLTVDDGEVSGEIRTPSGYEGRILTGRSASLAEVWGRLSFTSSDPNRVGLHEAPGGAGPGVGDAPPVGTDGSGDQAGRDDDTVADGANGTARPWFAIPSLVGGCGLIVLAIVLVVRRRRTDERHGPATEEPPVPLPMAPTPGSTVPGLAPLASPISEVDEAVRRLATLAHDAGQPFGLTAVRVGVEDVELLLDAPLGFPAYGFAGVDGRAWTIERESLASERAPGPSTRAFVSTGRLQGSDVLVDLADGITVLDGDDEAVSGLMRRWATELRECRWSAHPQVATFGTDTGLLGAGLALTTLEDVRALIAGAQTPTVLFVAPGEAMPDGADLGAGIVCRSDDGVAPTRTIVVGVDDVVLEPAGLHLEPVAECPLIAGGVPIEAVVADHRAAANEATPPDRRVLVRVLGSVAIEGAELQSAGWRKVKEIVAYLAFHRDGVSRDQIVAALWPEGLPSPNTFNQALSRARVALGNGDDGQPIIRPVAHGRYAAGPELVTDLELLEAALDAGAPTAGLIVGGTPFAEPEGYDWAYLEGHVARANVLIERAAQQEATKAS